MSCSINPRFRPRSGTRGLPQNLLDILPEEDRLRLPLIPGNRSLNLSNAVALTVYEDQRQPGFRDGK